MSPSVPIWDEILAPCEDLWTDLLLAWGSGVGEAQDIAGSQGTMDVAHVALGERREHQRT